MPLQEVDLACAELERCARDLGFPGLEICSSVNGLDFDDPRFVPFFEAVVAHDVALVIHPNGFSQGERLADYYLINTVGMPLDSTLFVARMIFGGVLERFPTLRICVVHGGGYVPFYPARFDHAYEARAETDVICYRVEFEAFLHLVETHSSVASDILKGLSRSLLELEAVATTRVNA